MSSIVTYPSDALSRAAKRVSTFGSALERQIELMTEEMYASGGVGLAAPQLGYDSSVAVVDMSAGEKSGGLVVMVNPEIAWRSAELVSSEEGCLSLPGVSIVVERPAAVRVSYADTKGTVRESLFDGRMATAVQHELDHLSGLLILDRAGPLARKLAVKQLQRARSQR